MSVVGVILWSLSGYNPTKLVILRSLSGYNPIKLLTLAFYCARISFIKGEKL